MHLQPQHSCSEFAPLYYGIPSIAGEGAQVEQLDATWTPILTAFEDVVVRSGLAALFLNVTGAANTPDFTAMLQQLSDLSQTTAPIAEDALVRFYCAVILHGQRLSFTVRQLTCCSVQHKLHY
jgi:hypothetical protein